MGICWGYIWMTYALYVRIWGLCRGYIRIHVAGAGSRPGRKVLGRADRSQGKVAHFGSRVHGSAHTVAA